MRNPFKVFIPLVVLSVFSIAAAGIEKDIPNKSQKQGVRKIVIDPGHGGSDFGASGKYSHEKDIALAVSLKLEEEIRKEMPGVEVYLTRTTDVFDHVRVKAEKANAAKGDLFIAIHCNDAAPSRHSELTGYKTVRYKKGRKWKTKEVPQYHTYSTPSTAVGTETYVWGVDKNDDKERALRENESIFSDEGMTSEQKNFNDPEQIAAISLRMGQYSDRSRKLAFSVQDEFTKVGRVNREARQRAVGIWVLQAVAMPAILVELGFISNPKEEDYMNSDAGQKELSQCISRAVKQYKANIENKMNVNGGGK